MILAAVPVRLAAHLVFGAEFDRNTQVRLRGKSVKPEWLNALTSLHLEIERVGGTKQVRYVRE